MIPESEEAAEFENWAVSSGMISERAQIADAVYSIPEPEVPDPISHEDFFKDPGDMATPHLKRFMLQSLEAALDRWNRGVYTHASPI